jgi:glycosyltransferase involved in cell wall biosynthesis
MKLYNKSFSILNQLKYFLYETSRLQLERMKNKKSHLINEPVIDIILPTYNRSLMLKERSIPSILNQTYKNFRLIIIGDCCTDDTEAVIKEFKDERIFFYNLSERKKRYPESVENHWFCGPVVAINKGLEFVSADWIARIDDDDIWEKKHLEQLLKFAIKYRVEFVSSHYTVVEEGNNILKDFSNEKPSIGGVQTWLYASYLKFFKANINCWRKSWNRVNDLDLQDRMYKSGVKMKYLSESTCIIKPRPDETKIGLNAYKENKKQFLNKYKFND